MNQKKLIETNNDDELTLREVILKLVEWRKYLLSKWLIILAVAIIGGGIGLGFSYMLKPRYLAELTFVMESSSGGNPLGAYIGLASQFGFDLGSSSSGIFEGDNILEFLKSRLMVEKTLLSPILIDNRKISLADWYLEFMGGKPELERISFPINADATKLTREQDSVMTVLYKKIIKENLLIDKVDKKLGFYTVNCTSGNENFSKAFTEILVKNATDFYIETKTIRAKSNVDRLQNQADTMEFLLNKKTYSAAAVQDLNVNPARQVANVPLELVTRDKMVLQAMYGEVVKNLELSKITMTQETPVIQIVDVPRLPLEEKKLSKFKGIFIGAFVAGFLVVAVLISRKIFQSILNE